MKLSPILCSAPRPTVTTGNHLVLSGVARTFLPGDVEIALEEIGATRSGAPTLVTKQPTAFTPIPPHLAFTPPPPSATFHLTFPSYESARLASLAIDRSPARFLGFPGGPKAEDGGKRSARGRVFVRKVEQDAERWLMTDAAREWTFTHRPAATSSESSEKDPGTLPHYLSSLRRRHPAPFDEAKRGLQVLLRGVPGTASEEQVRKLAEGFKVDDTYGVWRVPK